VKGKALRRRALGNCRSLRGVFVGYAGMGTVRSSEDLAKSLCETMAKVWFLIAARILFIYFLLVFYFVVLIRFISCYR